jgi:hypothetical protein
LTLTLKHKRSSHSSVVNVPLLYYPRTAPLKAPLRAPLSVAQVCSLRSPQCSVKSEGVCFALPSVSKTCAPTTPQPPFARDTQSPAECPAQTSFARGDTRCTQELRVYQGWEPLSNSAGVFWRKVQRPAWPRLLPCAAPSATPSAAPLNQCERLLPLSATLTLWLSSA